MPSLVLSRLSRIALSIIAALGLTSLTATAQDAQRWEHLNGAWVVEGRNGAVLGTVNLVTDETVSGEGRLRNGQEFWVQSRSLGHDAIVLDVIHGIGDMAHGTLTLTEEAVSGTQLTGTYRVGNRTENVRLVPSPVQDIALDDLPGVGLSGPPYRLRNAPADGWIPVYPAPRAASGSSVNKIWRAETDILVVDCDPWIEAHLFEEADFATRLRMLDGLWCQIQHTDAGGIVTMGWLPGSNLEPMRERM